MQRPKQERKGTLGDLIQAQFDGLKADMSNVTKRKIMEYVALEAALRLAKGEHGK